MDVDIATVAILGNAGGASLVSQLRCRHQRSDRSGCPTTLRRRGVLGRSSSRWRTHYPTSGCGPSCRARSPVALWINLVLVYTGRRSWLRPSRLIPLLIVANADVLLLLLGQGRFGQAIAVPVTQNGVTLLAVQRGVAFAATLTISYLPVRWRSLHLLREEKLYRFILSVCTWYLRTTELLSR